MTESPGTRSISVGGNAVGQLNTGDNNVLTNRRASDREALSAFVTMMSRELATVTMAEEHRAGTQAALAEIEEAASVEPVEPGRLRAAFARFASFLAEAGQPALTAVIMTLALNLGVVAPPK
ncbi:hypothetical protein [Streptomyces sp. WMMC940]|uniref:hypothetical protein n=1 Tax=Streptomyces sp. WMMC940 TaxID=3015153 RepID=UPI0022B71B52|nr:hypothetical protein [Streptomyces sp. WMMC940]MCZ7457007.1 hypothetical protein [Streptomyces sp. WMMC940]